MAYRGAWKWEGRSSVPPDKALAWWFDYREDDHASPEHASAHKAGSREGRKILSRGPNEVELEDRFGWRVIRAKMRRESDRIVGKTEMSGVESTTVYRFVPDGNGSRIVDETTFEIRGFIALLMPLFARKFQRMHDEDMNLHLAHMEREWREKPW